MVAELLSEHSEDLGGPVTVIAVSVHPDLHAGDVWVRPLTGDPQELMRRLETKRPEIQAEFSGKIVLKYTPKLRFRDATTEMDRIEHLIDSLP